MSRTIRRTNGAAAHHIVDWVLIDYLWNEHYSFTRVKIDRKSKEGQRLVNEYHRDGHRIMGSAPSWYCTIYQRQMRRAGERELFQFFNNLNYEPLIERNHRRSATYAWW